MKVETNDYGITLSPESDVERALLMIWSDGNYNLKATLNKWSVSSRRCGWIDNVSLHIRVTHKERTEVSE